MAWLENLARDVRLSLRSLAASPGFTLVAVVSLGLGIGAGTCVFSLVNAILVRPLPLPHPEDLRVLKWSAANVRMRSFDGASRVDGSRWTAAESVSPPAFVALRERAAAEADVFAFFPLRDAAVTAGDQSLVGDGMMVSDSFLSGLQVRPRIGRLLGSRDDYAGGAMNAVVSYRWWQRFFGLDPGVIGRTVALNGVPFTIVGVLEPGFSGIEPGRPSDFYVPLSASSPFLYTSITADWHWFVRLVARLRPGGTDARLRAALDAAFPGVAGPILETPRFEAEPGAAGLDYARVSYRRPLLLMLAVVGLVLLAACANLAGLLVARAAARSRELAVRAALGGTASRLFLQSLTDSLVIAVLGGGFGILLAAWGRAPLARLLAGQASESRYDFSMDRTVLVFSVAITMLTAVLAGVIPSIRAAGAEAMGAVRTRATVGAPRLFAARFLVVTQVCISLLVVTGAGLFLRSLDNLSRVDAGFGLERLLLVSLNIRGSANAQADPAGVYDRVQAEVAAIPGVAAAGIVEFPLLGPGGHSGGISGFVNAPAAASEEMTVRRLRVGDTFFAAMGIPIVEGRGPSPADTADAPKVVVVNRAFVRRYLDGRDAVGLAFRMWEAEWRIVGVCGDAKYNDIKEAVSPTAYFPYRQMFYSRFRATHLRAASIAVRTAMPPLALADAVRQAVGRADPGIAITAVTTQRDVRDEALGRERLAGILGGGLACVALLLSWIGLFGLMAYNVGRRTAEIGVRMALGATAGDITHPIVREALVLAAAGLAVGLPLTLALTRLVRSQLFGVTPGDPLSVLLGTGSIVVVAVAAAGIPAWRARRIEPTAALRHDG